MQRFFLRILNLLKLFPASMQAIALSLALLPLMLVIGFSPLQTAPAPLTLKAKLEANFGRLPLAFEQNVGQTDNRVKFLSRSSNSNIFLTSTEAVIALTAKTPSKHPTTLALRLTLEGANHQAKLEAEKALSGKINYFTGNDPKLWKTDIPTYESVRARNVYPKVDVLYYGNQKH